MIQHKIKKIILLGPKHVGKTSVAEQIAIQCSFPFSDTDADILLALQKKNQIYKSIAEAYEAIGPTVFQSYEAQAVAHVLATDAYIVATGGGLADNHKAFSYVQSAITAFSNKVPKTENTCLAVLLKDEGDTIWERVSQQSIPAFVKNAVFQQLTIQKKEMPDKETLHSMYRDYFMETFHRRNKIYASVANKIIEVQHKTPMQLAKEICAIL